MYFQAAAAPGPPPLIPLTTGEFNVLWALVSHPGQVLTREQVMELAWGPDAVGGPESATVLVSRIRERSRTTPLHPAGSRPYAAPATVSSRSRAPRPDGNPRTTCRRLSPPGPNTPPRAPFFVSSALVSGLSLVLLVASAARRWLGLRLEEPVRDGLGKLLALFIAVDLDFLGSEVLTTGYSGSADHRAQLDLLLSGPLAVSFWVEVTFGVFALTVFARRRTRLSIPWAVAGAGAAIGGVLLKRVNIVMASMLLPLFHLPPRPDLRPATPSASIWRTFGQYTPTWVEVVIVLGVLPLDALVVMAALPWAVQASRGGAEAGGSPRCGDPVPASASDGPPAPAV